MSDSDIDLTMPDVGVPVAAALPILRHESSRKVAPRPTTAAAQAVAEASFRAAVPIGRDEREELRKHGFPNGLIEELSSAKGSHPIRFWVVDNSGSMRSNDGHLLRATNNDKMTVVPCTRWAELQSTVAAHAELAGLVGVKTSFRMLNDPGVMTGPQEFSVCDGGRLEEEIQLAKEVMLKAEPKGVTPLTHHLQDIRSRIHAIEDTLNQTGRQVVIVIATDGLPSDKYGESTQEVQADFVNTLRSLQSLPVWIVVRLCTDDVEVVQYYNDLDSMLELPLEVIDDFWGESKEIHAANRWLNYALPLQRCREMGYHHRIFDLLDERLLNKDELKEFLTILFGSKAFKGAPDIHADWKGFQKTLTKIIKDEGKIFDPIAKKNNFWIDMKVLDRCFGGGGLRLFRGKK